MELITCTPVDPGLAHLAGVDADGDRDARCRGTRVRSSTRSGARRPRVVAGAETFASAGEPSAAARAIVSTCAVASDVPLAILCGGPLTNVAAAIALDPRICERAILVWIGGSAHDAPEYNRDTDAASAAAVLDSAMPIVQVPLETYERLRVSVAEVQIRSRGRVALGGAWIADRLLDLPPFVTLHGVLTLGDSALAAVVGLDPTFRPANAGVSSCDHSRSIRGSCWATFCEAAPS